MLPPEAINEFRAIFKAEYGIDLEESDATQRANNLMQFYQVIHRHKMKMKEKLCPTTAS